METGIHRKYIYITPNMKLSYESNMYVLLHDNKK